MNLPHKTQLHLSINGEDMLVLAETSKTLLEVLREDLGLTGTKHGCELGECGACTVLCDGKPVMSCLVLALECEDVKIETIEGMASDGQLHPLQQAFAEHGGSQCGYCTPGMLMTAQALLANVPEGDANPGREEIREALSGNLCRCTGYQQVIDSVEAAVVAISESGAKAAGSES